MRILPCLATFATLLTFVIRPVYAVMPPSTCLQVTDTESAAVPTDLKQQILEQIRKNDERLEQIQLEDRALAALLGNPPTNTIPKAAHS